MITRSAATGAEHAAEVLERLRQADLANMIVFEFFALPPASFLRDIDRCVRNWSMEFSPESHEQSVRDAQEGESGYTTADMEAIFRLALSLRCQRVDVFFMIGLPAQTTASVRDTVEYCGELFKLQKILGHQSIAMTERYAHLAPRAFVDDYARFGPALSMQGDVVALPQRAG